MPARKPRVRACWECKGGTVFLEPEKTGALSSLVRRVQERVGVGFPFGERGTVVPNERDGGKARQGERADLGQMPHSAPVRPACFRQLYSSRDGRFVVFEDAQGHLTSVDASRFA